MSIYDKQTNGGKMNIRQNIELNIFACVKYLPFHREVMLGFV